MLVNLLLLVIACLSYASTAPSSNSGLHPDVGLDTVQLVRKYGYPFENHTAITEDGYILELHRIPRGKSRTSVKSRGPVLILPALLSNSAEYVNTGNNSLGFILADNGYDVWLGNSRGTTWSRKHRTLDPDRDKKEFWGYSADEMGTKDLPAFIDYILQETGHKKLFYVGHSQGTALFFMMASAKPEYNSKIRLMTALSPVIRVERLESITDRFLMSSIGFFEPFVEFTGSYEVLPHNSALPSVSEMLCNDVSFFQPGCVFMLYLISGFSEDQLDPSLIPVIVSNIPAGASYRQLQHVEQIYSSRCFCHFDYGEEINLKKYGQTKPLAYNLSRITAPIAAYYGDSDYLLPHESAVSALENLPNVVLKRLIKGFNHLDVVWGKDAPAMVFKDVLEAMKNY